MWVLVSSDLEEKKGEICNQRELLSPAVDIEVDTEGHCRSSKVATDRGIQ